MNDVSWDRTKYLYASIGKLITSSLERDEIFRGIMEEIDTFFSPENWSLLRLDSTTNSLFFSIIKGCDYEKVRGINLSPGEGIAGTVAITGESIFVPDTSLDKRFSDKVDRILGFKTRSIIAVPLIFRDRVYGVIEIVNRKNGRNFTEDEHLILKTIADFSAIAFANSGLYEQVCEANTTDPLTGLYNQARLASLIDEWKDDSHHGRRRDDMHSRKAVIFIDLDDFKTVNDLFGHKEGDMALTGTARLLRSIVRRDDMLFRVGGDEFLAIISLGDDRGSEEVITRIERDLEKSCYLGPGERYSISMSWGTAVGETDRLSELIDEADRQMYRRKKIRHEKSRSNTD